MFTKIIKQSQFALFVATLKNLTWNQMKKNHMIYYYLYTSCEWAINFHMELYRYVYITTYNMKVSNIHLCITCVISNFPLELRFLTPTSKDKLECEPRDLWYNLSTNISLARTNFLKRTLERNRFVLGRVSLGFVWE